MDLKGLTSAGRSDRKGEQFRRWQRQAGSHGRWWSDHSSRVVPEFWVWLRILELALTQVWRTLLLLQQQSLEVMNGEENKIDLMKTSHLPLFTSCEAYLRHDWSLVTTQLHISYTKFNQGYSKILFWIILLKKTAFSEVFYYFVILLYIQCC